MKRFILILKISMKISRILNRFSNIVVFSPNNKGSSSTLNDAIYDNNIWPFFVSSISLSLSIWSVLLELGWKNIRIKLEDGSVRNLQYVNIVGILTTIFFSEAKIIQKFRLLFHLDFYESYYIHKYISSVNDIIRICLLLLL